MAQSVLTLPDAAATEAAGAALASLWSRDPRALHLVALEGELGTGKTTLVRGFLRGLGFTGRVRSPTYTLVEPYEIDAAKVFHLDLYRLGTAEELELLGFRDMDRQDTLILVEWPERVPWIRERADLYVILSYREQSGGRTLSAVARSVSARAIVAAWVNALTHT